jgi:hypothetical protein
MTTGSEVYDYMPNEFCDQKRCSAANGAKPASAQSLPSLIAVLATSITEDGPLPKTRHFLSFHIDQTTRSSNESNKGLEARVENKNWSQRRFVRIAHECLYIFTSMMERLTTQGA